MSAFVDLYVARVDCARATPGSREWWDAIRRMRTAARRIHRAVRGFYDAFVTAFEAVRPAIEALADAVAVFRGDA